MIQVFFVQSEQIVRLFVLPFVRWHYSIARQCCHCVHVGWCEGPASSHVWPLLAVGVGATQLSRAHAQQNHGDGAGMTLRPVLHLLAVCGGH